MQVSAWRTAVLSDFGNDILRRVLEREGMGPVMFMVVCCVRGRSRNDDVLLLVSVLLELRIKSHRVDDSLRMLHIIWTGYKNAEDSSLPVSEYSQNITFILE